MVVRYCDKCGSSAHVNYVSIENGGVLEANNADLCKECWNACIRDYFIKRGK